MTSTTTTLTATPNVRLPLPALENGDRMTQAEFHRRYEAYPEDVKVELIGGIVFMAAAARRPHGRFQLKLGTVFDQYELHTPGVEAGDNSTTILDKKNEPQPDLHLRVLEQFGGQSHVNQAEYVVGPPELLAEIAHSSVSIDLNAKKDNYRLAGVLEYIVVCVEERKVLWFDLKKDRELKPNKKGIIRSQVFPGLWLDAAALLSQDTNQLLAVLQQGLDVPEHGKFVKTLERKRKRRATKPKS